MRINKRGKKPARSRAKATWATRLERRMRTMSTCSMFLGAIGAAALALVIGAVSAGVGTGRTASRSAASTPQTAPAAAATETPAAAAAAAPVEPVAPTSVVKAAPVTLTGCLERDADTFRLKETTGEDAPKARSWKSGFLRKRAVSVALVEPPTSVRLPTHVGERVSVTGTLLDREMHVRSLQRVAASCSMKS